MMLFNLPRAGHVYLRDPNLVAVAPADGLAPLGARPLAGTVMTTNVCTFPL